MSHIWWRTIHYTITSHQLNNAGKFLLLLLCGVASALNEEGERERKTCTTSGSGAITEYYYYGYALDCLFLNDTKFIKQFSMEALDEKIKLLVRVRRLPTKFYFVILRFYLKSAWKFSIFGPNFANPQLNMDLNLFFTEHVMFQNYSCFIEKGLLNLVMCVQTENNREVVAKCSTR